MVNFSLKGPSSHGHVCFKKLVAYIYGRSGETLLGLLCEAFPVNSSKTCNLINSLFLKQISKTVHAVLGSCLWRLISRSGKIVTIRATSIYLTYCVTSYLTFHRFQTLCTQF